ncbi:MAG: HNH endonuclease [Planctomycetes bacterium]|nr:HNH endonuclease [Planctomycetota bacterium]
METWKPIPGYERFYEVSDRGRIRRSADRRYFKKGTPIATTPHYGYIVAGLSAADGTRRQWMVHILVLAAFVGPKPEGLDTDHINGDKTDNRLGNLEYVTRCENMQRAIAMGFRDNVRGSGHCNAKFTDDDVRDIRKALDAGETQTSIALRYSVWQTTIGQIALGNTWKHIA